LFEFLDHESEAMVQVRAATIQEVFEDAAVALFELMTDVSQVRTDRQRTVTLSAPERHFLLIDWLNRLILLHEVDNATVSGEPISDKHEKRLHAKSATFGQFEWIEEPPGHRVRFVIDI
jgi:SHS2 domain-containing protein